mgnify:CR=1 FL=1
MVYWIIWVLFAIIALVLVIIIFYYNRFNILKNRIHNSLSQIDVQLKRRSDLIPNLLETVKGYAKHEKQIMTDVTNARKVLMGAKDLGKKMIANNVLENALGKLFAIAENYPQLRANENFLELQRELAATEDRVAYSRQNYNDSILSYNNLCKTFPGAMFAGMFGHKEMEYLKIAEAERKVVNVKFDE